jgi:hypothetical protein
MPMHCKKWPAIRRDSVLNTNSLGFCLNGIITYLAAIQALNAYDFVIAHILKVLASLYDCHLGLVTF